MAPMTRLRSLAVVPPPPSFDPSSYEPFDDQVNRTIDQILTEEASFESTRDEDWPVYSGGDSSSASNKPTSHNDKDAKKSRFFSKPPAPNGTKGKGKRKPVARRNITVIELESDSEDDVAPPNTNGHEPTEATDEVPDAGNEADNESPMDDQPANDADVSMDMWDPMSQGVDGVAEPTISDEPAADEEDAIFASVDLSQRNHLLHYLASHPFMQNMAQPVSRSARRSFVKEMRREATTAGMDVMAVDRLIEYVRNLYLEELGIGPQPLPEDLDELPFGEEIEDDHLEEVGRRKSRKRSLDSAEQTNSKKKKRKKEDRKSSKELSESSLQSALQQHVSEGIQAAESSLQDSFKVQDDEKGAVKPGSAVDNQDLAAGPWDDDHVKENGDHALRDVTEQKRQHEEPPILDVQHTEDTTMKVNGGSVPLEEQPMGDLGLSGQQRDKKPSAPDKGIVESSHSEPELPPNHAQVRRGSKDKGNKKRHEEPPKSSKTKKASQPVESHPSESALSGNLSILPSKPEPASKPLPEPSSTLLETSQNGNREEQRRDVKKSGNEGKENCGQNTSVDVVQHSAPAQIQQEMELDITEQKSKKHKNWRKKEKKKKKKRHSYLKLQGNPPIDDQASEPQPMPAPMPVSLPEPSTPQKSSKKSKFSVLSPNPDEWDLDF